MASTRSVVDRCLRALSPYDCRRHAATLAGRDPDRARRGPDGYVPRDFVSTLSAAQRAGVQAGIDEARLREDTARAEGSDPGSPVYLGAHGRREARVCTDTRTAQRRAQRRRLALGVDPVPHAAHTA